MKNKIMFKLPYVSMSSTTKKTPRSISRTTSVENYSLSKPNKRIAMRYATTQYIKLYCVDEIVNQTQHMAKSLTKVIMGGMTNGRR